LIIQDYLKFNIAWREKKVLAQIRTSSYRLRCETGRWKEPKEKWENRACWECGKGEVEPEQLFLLHYEADSHIEKGTKLENCSWEAAFWESHGQDMTESRKFDVHWRQLQVLESQPNRIRRPTLEFKSR
jgi:hypothetical protein